MIKVSVVIPAYNEEKLIERCLLSLAKQTFPRKYYEIIVVDNASVDRTEELAKKYADKVLKEPRKGLLFARQKGFEAARGKIVLRTDADAFVPMDWIERAWKNFEKNKEMVALGGFYFLDDNNFWLNTISRLAIFLNYWQYRIFGNVKKLSGPCSAFRKDSFDKSGGFDLGADPCIGDQIAIAYKMAKYGKVGFDKDWWVWFSPRRVYSRLKSGIKGFINDYFLYEGLGSLYFIIFKKYPQKTFGSGWEDFRP